MSSSSLLYFFILLMPASSTNVTTTSFTVVRFTLIARSSRSSKGIPNLCICIRKSHAFNTTDQYPNTFLLLNNFDSKHFSTHRINYVNNQQTVSKLWTTELCILTKNYHVLRHMLLHTTVHCSLFIVHC